MHTVNLYKTIGISTGYEDEKHTVMLKRVVNLPFAPTEYILLRLTDCEVGSNDEAERIVEVGYDLNDGEFYVNVLSEWFQKNIHTPQSVEQLWDGMSEFVANRLAEGWEVI